jgi:hypothetical protein
MGIVSVRRGVVGALLAAIACVGCSAGVPTSSAPSISASPPSSAGPSPAASSEPTPQASVAWVPYTSNRYRYVMSYPSGWKSEARSGVGGLHPGEGDEAGMDLFYEPLNSEQVKLSGGGSEGVTQYVGVSHYDLPAGTKLDSWVSPTEKHIKNDHGVQPESVEKSTIAGEPARIEKYHVRDSDNVYTAYVAEVVHNAAGYTIESLYSQPIAAADLSTFDVPALARFMAMLVTLKFT